MERLLLIVALFLSTAPVSRAEEDLFVLKGDSVRLDVKRHEELQFGSISWSVNDSREYNLADRTQPHRHGNQQDTIHCNSSNRVATKTQSYSTKDICPPEGPGGISSAKLISIIIIIIGILIIVIIIVSVILCRRKRRSGGSTIETQCNTEYASVQDMGIRTSSTGGTVYDVVTNVRTEAPLEVKTTYETLGPAGEPRQQPESVYATVNKIAP
ncbi:hypothetical protein COCON_G00137290 [Conger conger]|uniref:Uncharacterized protein n=1 Tax=Conger conger TaxID=82655 RepID=A0A9Q1HXW1_CONCO|nr:hypothetical protein COCON_G00137290 [Conger conger]